MKRMVTVAFFLVAMLFTGAEAPAELRLYGPKGKVPDWIIVQGLGGFPVTDGSVDIHGKVNELKKKTGRKIEIPSKMRIFFPSTETSAAHLTTVSASDIRRGHDVQLRPERGFGEGQVMRVFHGPRLVDTDGNEVVGANVYFDGRKGRDTKVAAGPLNPSVMMGVNEKKVTAIIHKPGYELAIVPVKLTSEEVSDGELKPALASEDIVLYLAQNSVRQVTVTGSYVKVNENPTKTIRYFRQKDGQYGFRYKVSDHVNRKHYVASGLLADTLTHAELLPYVEDANDSLFSVFGRHVPASLPIVVIDDQVEYVVPASEETASSGPPQQAEPFNPLPTLLPLLIIAAVVLALLFGTSWLIGFVKKRNESRDAEARSREANLRKAFVASGADGGYELLCRVREILKNDLLQEAFASVLKNYVDQMEELALDIASPNPQVAELKAKIAQLDQLIKEQVKAMNTAVNDGQYDSAKGMKTVIEEAERSRDALAAKIEEYEAEDENKKTALKALVDAVAEKEKRANGLMNHVRGARDFTGLANEIVEIMKGINASKPDLTVNVDPEKIRKTQEARSRAQRTGIDANDVEDMKQFLSERRQ